MRAINFHPQRKDINKDGRTTLDPQLLSVHLDDFLFLHLLYSHAPSMRRSLGVILKSLLKS